MQVGAKIAEVATKIAILASFGELSWMIFWLLSSIFAEMGEVEKRTTLAFLVDFQDLEHCLEALGCHLKRNLKQFEVSFVILRL